MKRELYIVESTMQVLCSLCMANTIENNGDERYRTLLVNDRFFDAGRIAEGVAATGLFDEVHLVSPQYEGYGGSGLSCLVETEREQQKRFARVRDALRVKCGYDRLYFAGPNQLTRDAKRFCVDGKSALIDDGTGSHNGAIVKAFSFFDDIIDYSTVHFTRQERLKDSLKRICRPFYARRLAYNVDSLYLFNPGKRDRAHYKNVQFNAVPTDSDGIEDVIRIAFSLGIPSKAFHGKTIYLSLPDHCDQRDLEDERVLLQFLAKSNPGTVFRPHPRRDDLSAVPYSMSVDQERAFWEGMWMIGALDNSTTLIGLITSQMLV